MSLIAECYRRLTDSSASDQPLRGFKVTDVNRSRKIGIACRTLQELKQKACTKFNVTENWTKSEIYLIDGSEIDEEYFKTLQPQTTLVLRLPGEEILSEADLLYQMLRKANESLYQKKEKAVEFLTDKLKEKVAALNKMLNNDDEKTKYSKRQDHPEWFLGLETSCSTKEAYLHRRCQDRIRGYLYKTIGQIKSSEIYKDNRKARRQLNFVIAFFKLQLRKDHYFGHYFDRSQAISSENDDKDKDDKDKDDKDKEKSNDDTDTAENCCYEHCPCKLSISDYERNFFGLNDDEVDAKKFMPSTSSEKSRDDVGINKDDLEKEELQDIQEKCPYEIIERNQEDMKALCNRAGEFRCSGVWNLEKCLYEERHKINPYRSKEELVIFSTWNLDHKIERSRTLVPQILEASIENNIKEKDVHEFYDNLFTQKNLRLVHIVCHDKGSHK